LDAFDDLAEAFFETGGHAEDEALRFVGVRRARRLRGERAHVAGRELAEIAEPHDDEPLRLQAAERRQGDLRILLALELFLLQEAPERATELRIESVERRGGLLLRLRCAERRDA